MIEFYAIGALVLAATIVVGLVPTLRARDPADRLLAAQLLGTAGVGTLLLLAPVLALDALGDVALILALLAAVAVTALTRRERGTEHG